MEEATAPSTPLLWVPCTVNMIPASCMWFCCQCVQFWMFVLLSLFCVCFVWVLGLFNVIVCCVFRTKCRSAVFDLRSICSLRYVSLCFLVTIQLPFSADFLFTAYSLPIHSRFTAWPLRIHCLFSGFTPPPDAWQRVSVQQQQERWHLQEQQQQQQRCVRPSAIFAESSHHPDSVVAGSHRFSEALKAKQHAVELERKRVEREQVQHEAIELQWGPEWEASVEKACLGIEGNQAAALAAQQPQNLQDNAADEQWFHNYCAEYFPPTPAADGDSRSFSCFVPSLVYAPLHEQPLRSAMLFLFSQ
jgi:hypothetical protein